MEPGNVSTAVTSPVAADCLHCGLPVLSPGSRFCCRGCEAVHTLLSNDGLDRFYSLRGARGTPVRGAPDRRDLTWLESIEAELAARAQPMAIILDVQGIHCAGCVWLIQELFAREAHGMRIVVNPTLGRAELLVAPDFRLRSWVIAVERFGYLFGLPRKPGQRDSSALLLRAVICLVLTGNAMLLAAAVYLGLETGPLHRLVNGLSFALGLAAVAVGGPVFFRPALAGLRRGLVSFDVPISAGILLAVAGSGWALASGSSDHYLDTLAVFVSLMLVGRWLQQRIIERNREQLLDTAGVADISTRRLEGERVVLVPCTAVRRGDHLSIAPGELVPVDATAVTPDCSISLDWITGESVPRAVAAGEAVPAGAFNAGSSTITVAATTDFAQSPLIELIGSGATPSCVAAPASLVERIARPYVAVVLIAAAVGFLGWWLIAGDLPRALAVATAVLVVTCPCAIGIATPLAYQLVVSGLRRAGLFVRSPDFFERARIVSRVAFDKTGTLTDGAPELENGTALDTLTPAQLAALHTMAASTSHPASQAITRALAGRAVPVRANVIVREEPGLGIAATIDGVSYRLGAPGWAALAPAGTTALVADGVLLAAFRISDSLRPDAAVEVAALGRDGYEVWIVSGDTPARVHVTAEAIGVPVERARGGSSPHDKAAWVEASTVPTLLVGDGINDSLAAARATCSGTPAIDRPFMAARTDFYFVTPGLGPVRTALRAARALERIARRNLAFAVAYNLVTVGLAWAGLVTPVIAAILMPASSVALVLATSAALSPRSSLWRS